MRTATSVLFVFILIFFLPNTKLHAQEVADTSAVFQVETRDGNTFLGEITFKDASILKIKTDNLGELTIPVTNIKTMKKLVQSQVKNGQLWFENPHSTRYFYLPNGYGLKKGEGYYQNAWVLFNQASYGFTDNFSMGLGLVPTFLFGASGFPVWITPKFSIPIKKDAWNLGIGAIAGTYFGSESNVVGLVYGVSTFGSRDKNVTIGGGYGFAGNEWGSKPIVSLGGLIRTGKRHYLMTENYFFFGDNEVIAMIWFGGRFVNPHLAIDYGLITPAGASMDTFVAIPWLGITVPFGTPSK